MKISLSKVESINKVKYDQRNGLGSVPFNADVDYFGYAVLMQPSVFLKLAKPLNTDKEDKERLAFMEKYLLDGGTVGSPFLKIEVKTEENEDGNDIPVSHGAKIVGHEGRHRAMAIRALYGDIPMLVHLFFAHLRRRNVDESLLEEINQSLIPEGKHAPIKGPFWKVK